MLIVNLKGGLGNQMFQYATGLDLIRQIEQNKKNYHSEQIRQLKTVFLLDISGYSDPRVVKSNTPRTFDLKHFNITAQIADFEKIQLVKYPTGIWSKICRGLNKKIFRNFYQDYHPQLLEKHIKKMLLGQNVYLDGFFQSEKNFINSRSKILEEFELRDEHKTNTVKNLAEQISLTESVSIHIRRGDYANNSTTKKYHGLCPISYYSTAIKMITDIKKYSNFYIFTDDLNWVKENLKIEQKKIFISGQNLTSQQELFLMSKCKHNIIANSSFSWWGAWLNQNQNKIIIAPEKWTIKNNNHPNILPKDWIEI